MGPAGGSGRVRVGTSGWTYRDWRGGFYPRSVPQRAWLAYYAARFVTVELNATFYRLPDRDGFRAWAAQTPDGFVFAVKASRFLTHYRRLREPGPPVRRLLAAAAGLGDRLGPVLVQLPPDLAVDVARLEALLAAFGGRVRVACEFRHRSWFDDAVYAVLSAHDAALVATDRRGRVSPLVATASWGFVRLHEGRATPAPCYGRQALATWVERVGASFGSGSDVYVYFNNDHAGCAVRDAARFAGMAGRAGLAVAAPSG